MTGPLKTASVSVVIPTYNCSALLPRAILSAFEQTVTPLEVIVVDDGCTDDTAEIIGRMTGSVPCSFRYIQKSNRGEPTARNVGVSLAKGDYIAFLDQDDVWVPDKIEQQMELFEQDPSLSMSFTAYTRVSGSNRELVRLSGWDPSPVAALRQLIEGSCMPPSTVVVRRQVLSSVGWFDESLRLGCDWDMWLQIAAAGHRIGYIATPLTDYHWHTTNMSRDPRRIGRAAQLIFPRLFKSGTLPPAIQRLERRCLSRWGLINACYCLDAGDLSEARRQILEAMHRRPASIRPGWVLLFLRTLVPRARGLWTLVDRAQAARRRASSIGAPSHAREK